MVDNGWRWKRGGGMGYNGKPPKYGGDGAPLSHSQMGFLPPPPPVLTGSGSNQPAGTIATEGMIKLAETTAIKGRYRRTVIVRPAATSVLAGYAWHARIETGGLGYPDTLTHQHDGPDFPDKAKASYEAGRIMGLWLKDGWQFCENWKAEHSHERMQSAKLRLSDQVKNRKGKPLFTTIEYPEPYHLAKYILVKAESAAMVSDYAKAHYFDYETAAQANVEAKKRIDYAVSQGYQLMAQSAAATGQNVQAASAAVKLALDAPVADDFSGLIQSFKLDSDGRAEVYAEVQTHLKLDNKFLKLACDRSPFQIDGGMFYIQDTNQKTISYGGTSTIYGLTIRGHFVAGVKAVGGATMPAMSLPKTIAEATAKPPEPQKIRYLELED